MMTLPRSITAASKWSVPDADDRRSEGVAPISAVTATTTDNVDVHFLEGLAARAARQAAALIRERLGFGTGIALKSSPTDIVTQTDLDAEALIRATIAAELPDAGVLGEEGGHTQPAAPLQWIIDPLDGTVNFSYAVPIFAVSVACAYRGTVMAGAVIDVMRDELFTATLGHGARLNGIRITTSRCVELSQALLTTGFSYRASLRQEHGMAISQLLALVRDVRCFGSAALHLCWLATGRVDMYFERDIKLWDYAAGALIASEAGAVVELPCPENGGAIMCAPTVLLDQLQRVLGDLTR
jgi:myo-inositol-1(or 4)-monophosphatase